MSVENGEWVMKGVSSRHPECIHTVEELEEYIESIGFLPLFANGKVFLLRNGRIRNTGGRIMRSGIHGLGENRYPGNVK